MSHCLASFISCPTQIHSSWRRLAGATADSAVRTPRQQRDRQTQPERAKTPRMLRSFASVFIYEAIYQKGK